MDCEFEFEFEILAYVTVIFYNHINYQTIYTICKVTNFPNWIVYITYSDGQIRKFLKIHKKMISIYLPNYITFQIKQACKLCKIAWWLKKLESFLKFQWGVIRTDDILGDFLEFSYACPWIISKDNFKNNYLIFKPNYFIFFSPIQPTWIWKKQNNMYLFMSIK